jgi:hypothetical protein
MPGAREHIRALAGDVITLKPFKKGYSEARLAGNCAGLFDLVGANTKMLENLVAGAGFEPTTFGL